MMFGQLQYEMNTKENIIVLASDKMLTAKTILTMLPALIVDVNSKIQSEPLLFYL